MARTPMVTRTLVSTRANVLCLDVLTAEPTNQTFDIARTFKDEDKHTAHGNYDYYMIDFDTTEAVFDGEEDTDSGKGINQMEMGITKTEDGKQAITIFTSSYNMYYCYSD